MLDALGAGAGKLMGTDMDARTHSPRCDYCGGTVFAVIEGCDTESCLKCGKVKKDAPADSPRS